MDSGDTLSEKPTWIILLKSKNLSRKLCQYIFYRSCCRSVAWVSWSSWLCILKCTVKIQLGFQSTCSLMSNGEVWETLRSLGTLATSEIDFKIGRKYTGVKSVTADAEGCLNWRPLDVGTCITIRICMWPVLAPVGSVGQKELFWAMGEEIDMRWGCSCGYSRMNFTRHKIHCRRRDQVGQNLLFGNLLFGDVKSVTSLLAPATAAPHPLLPAFCKIEEEKKIITKLWISHLISGVSI